MMSGRMRYGAVATKVRGLFGKRLRAENYQHMASLKSESEVFEYLRQCPAWSVELSALASTQAGGYLGRIELETALREQMCVEYASLMHYLSGDDAVVLRFPVLNAERQAILNTLRRLKSGGYYKGLPPTNRYLLQSSIDRKALEECKDYDGLLAAAADSVYLPALRHLREGVGLPDYTAIDSLLDTVCASYLSRIIATRYKGQTKALLLKSHGMQIDINNIMHILRLKRYFPNAGNDVYLTVLNPINYKLRPEMIHSLCAAPDLDAAFALLQSTPYRDCFADVDVSMAENACRRMLYTFFRRTLVSGEPSVHTPIAYLYVKEYELQVLVNILESIKYGVPHDAVMANLVGS